MGMCLLLSLPSLGWIHAQEPQDTYAGILPQRAHTNPVLPDGSQEANLPVWWDLNSGITLHMH